MKNLIISTKNKKGIEKMMTIWWFFIWVVIIVAVVVNVAIFVNRDIDYRHVDATILGNKISLCINQEKVDLFQENVKENFVKNCNFYDDAFQNGDHAVKIIIYDGDKKIEPEITIGATDMFKQCEIKENSNAKQYPECAIKSIFFTKGDKNYVIDIITASNLKGGRVLSQDTRIT